MDASAQSGSGQGVDPLVDRLILLELEAAVGRPALEEMLDLVPSCVAEELTRIDTALVGGRLDEVRAAAHTLKGLSANLGLSRLARAALRLEQHVRELPRTAPQVDELANRVASAAAETVAALNQTRPLASPISSPAPHPGLV